MIIWGNVKLNARIRALIKRMENAPDFGYDDEEVLLKKLLKEKGLRYGWNNSISNPELIIFKNTKENVKRLYKEKKIDITPQIAKREGWKEDIWGVNKDTAFLDKR